MVRQVFGLLLLLVGGCGSTHEDPAPVSPEPWSVRACLPTHDAVGPACIPRFDSCVGSVPRLGGGCTEVGPDVCPAGFTLDAPGCTTTTPTCTAGTMALPGDIACSDVAACGAPPTSTLLVDPAGALRTLGAALAIAKAGDTIAVAEGWHRGPEGANPGDPAGAGEVIERLLASTRPNADLDGRDAPDRF